MQKGFPLFVVFPLSSCQKAAFQRRPPLQTEGEKILAAVGNAPLIALCIEGKALSSEALSLKIDSMAVNGASKLCFVIGSSFGLSDSVKCAANLRLSMSPMTFPHQLARVMLCEQIYRAFQILNHGKYHK